MRWNSCVLMLFYLGTAIGVVAQVEPKKSRKAESKYSKGEYTASYRVNKKNISSLEKQCPQCEALCLAYLRQASYAEATHRYKEMDKYLELGLSQAEALPAASKAKAYVLAADAYAASNQAAKAMTMLDKAQPFLKDAAGVAVFKHFFQTKIQVLLHLGYFNQAIRLNDSLLKINQALILRPTKNDTSAQKLTKKQLKAVKREQSALLNKKNELFLHKGYFSALDTALLVDNLWIKKNVGKRNFYFRDNLYQAAMLAEYKGDRKLALKYYEKAYKYTKFSKLEKNGLAIQQKLISLYYQKNKKHESVKLRVKFDRTARQFYGKNSLMYAQFKAQEIDQYIIDSKYDKAEKRFQSLYKINTDFTPHHPFSIELLKTRVGLSIRRSALSQAKDTISRMVNLARQLYGEEAPRYHMYKMQQAAFYSEYMSNFAEARKIQEYSFEKVLKDQLYMEHPTYNAYLQQTALTYDLLEKYELAVKYLDQAAANIRAYYGDRSLYLASDLEKMAGVLLKKGDYAKAEELVKEAVKIFQSSSAAKESSERIASYLTLAKLYTTLGLYDEAEDALRKASKYSKRSKSQGGVKSAEELASLYLKQGRYAEAERLLDENTLILEKKLGATSRELITPLNLFGQLYIITGNYTAAEKKIKKAMEVAAINFTENSVKYTECLRLIENLYRELGDYKKAEETDKQILAIQQKVLGNNHIDVAATLTRMGMLALYINGNAAESEKLFSQALGIVRFNLGEDNPTYADQLKNLALFCIETKKLDRADSLLQASNNIWVSKLGKNNVNSADIIFLKGNVNYLRGNFKESERNYKTARTMYEGIFSKKHPSYVRSTSRLARVAFINKEYSTALKLINETTKNYLEFTKKYFPSLSFNEKSKYWNQIKEDFEFFNSMAFTLSNSNPALVAQMYNNQLATKALLLSSSIKIRERILNSKDERLIGKYNEWTSKKQALVNAISLSKEAQAESGINPDKLNKEIEQLEKELSESSELFSQNIESKPITWSEVRKSLAANEFALEFIRFRTFETGFTDKIQYAALLIDPKNSKSPRLIPLENGKDMEKKYIKYYKNVIITKADEDQYSYANYWEPVKKYIPDGARVYVSSEGVYNELNIETLQAEDGSYPIDKNEIVYLTNTKELIGRKKESKGTKVMSPSSVSLIGNPTFYASASAVRKSTGSVDRGLDRAIAKPGFQSAAASVISQLPGTEVEVKEIRSLFAEKKWNIRFITNDAADEDSVKNLDNPKIVHIATHGYFSPDLELTSTEGLSSTEAEFAQNPLLRSGLLLKGAGDVLKSGNTLQINSENGVLTAYEAMDLNFDNTDLVVLSACETGKGEVQIGEGVFGLQRSILVAGANTMVMTLFKVDDEVTKELMINFYSRWLSTGNLRESFYLAKKDIKAKHKHAVYWGAFVMVGLEN